VSNPRRTGPNHEISSEAPAAPVKRHKHGFLQPLSSKSALFTYAVVVCCSVLVSHSMTYSLINSGLGMEANPGADATIWMPPILNITFWEGGVVTFFATGWRSFRKYQDLFMPLALALTVVCAADAANDIFVCFQVGLL